MYPIQIYNILPILYNFFPHNKEFFHRLNLKALSDTKHCYRRLKRTESYTHTRTHTDVRGMYVREEGSKVSKGVQFTNSLCIQFTPINPKPFLRDLVNERVIVTLKFNQTQYHGTLVSTDNYFNIQLKDAQEWVQGESRGDVGEIFIRCNNVLWISQEQGTEGDDKNKTKPATTTIS